VITGVTPGSPADHLQVHFGSEIVAVNGQSTLGLERRAVIAPECA
jgi:C-terminal processing protease CtpA/Prc